MNSPVKFLKGYRALDLTGLSGQLCGRILADLGMEVIKIEPPGGDPVRRLPPFIKSPEGKQLSTTFAHLNAGKASKVLDLANEADRDALRRMVETADVVLESFSPRQMESMGLGYKTLAAINRGVVMASITAFGQTGPKKNLTFNDLVALAQSGFLYISGDPSLPPVRPPETQAYYFASLFAAAGVLAALYQRERTGQDDHVDASMQETLATHEHIIRLYSNDKQVVKRAGSQHGQVAPARIFPCSDGFVYLYVTRQHWKLFLEIWQDHPAEMDAPDWVNNLYRRAHADQINAAVEAFARKYIMEEFTNLLQGKGIPCVPVNTPLGFANDEHVQGRGFMVAVDHADFGPAKQSAMPFVIDGARIPVGSVPVLDSWRSPSDISSVAGERREGADRLSPGWDSGKKPTPVTKSVSAANRDNGPLDGMRIVLGYDDLRRVKSDIINLRMPGLGTTGPKRHFSTVGVNITAFTGLTYLWNHSGITNPPIGSQVVFPDYVSGVLCAIIIISGVLYRDRHKKGAFIDLAQSEATAFMIGARLMEAVASGEDHEHIGNASPSAAPHDCYPCKGEDSSCVIAAENGQQWVALARVLGSEVVNDARFKTLNDRLRHREELNAAIARWTQDKDAFEIMARLQQAGVPCGVVQTGEDLANDPQLKERGFIVAVENPRLGRVVLPNFPLQFANARLTRRWEFPVLGRDTEAVLRDVVGYTPETIRQLGDDGVLE